MKGIKKLFLSLLCASCVVSLAACGEDDATTSSSTTPTASTQPEESSEFDPYVDTPREPRPEFDAGVQPQADDILELSSITVDTYDAKTLYEVGDNFTSDGVSVSLNIMVYRMVNGTRTRIGIHREKTTSFAVNNELVDLNTPGTYKVGISCKFNGVSMSNNYTIKVVESIFASTPKLVYNTGLYTRLETEEPTYVEKAVTKLEAGLYTYNEKNKTYVEVDLSASSFDAKTKYYVKGRNTVPASSIIKTYSADDNMPLSFDADFTKSDGTVTSLKKSLTTILHYNRTMEDGTTLLRTKEVALDDSHLVIDSSEYDNAQVVGGKKVAGTYRIYVTYKGDPITINGVPYNNDVKSFIIVSIVENISSISVPRMADKSITFNPSFATAEEYLDAKQFDMKVTYKNKTSKTITWSSNDYAISSKNSLDFFNPDLQNVEFIYKDNTDIEVAPATFQMNLGGYTFHNLNDTKADGVIKSRLIDLKPKGSIEPDTDGLIDKETQVTGAIKDAEGRLKLDNEGLIYGPAPSSATAKYLIDDNAYSMNSELPSYNFNTRVWIQGSEILVKTPTDDSIVVVMFTPSSDAERTLLFGSNTVEGFKELQIKSTEIAKAEKGGCKPAIFQAGAKGDYYITAEEGMYIYGIFIMSKEAA